VVSERHGDDALLVGWLVSSCWFPRYVGFRSYW
jgi:hypothetical protein